MIQVFLSLYAYSGAAQKNQNTQPTFRHFTNNNSGLPTNTIYKVIADNYGYVWMATERGMVRYDGKRFNTYGIANTDNEFIQVYRPTDSLLWLFGYAGNSRLLNLKTQIFSVGLHEPDNATFKSPVILAFQKLDTLSLYRINSLYTTTLLSDPKKYWLKAKEVFISDLLSTWCIPGATSHAFTDSIASLFRSKPYVIQIAGDYLTIGNKIFQKRPGSNALLLFDGSINNVSDNISSFTKVGSDLYLGFVEAQELLCIKKFFEKKGSTAQMPVHVLSGVPVTSLCADYQGNLWVGSLGKGIYLFSQSDIAMQYLTVNRMGTKEVNASRSISRLSNGLLAIGQDGNRLRLLSNNKSYDISISEEKSLNEIRGVYKTRDHWYFFGRQQSYIGIGKTFPGKIGALPISSNTPFKDGIVANGKYYFTTKTATFIVNKDGSLSTDSKYKGNNTLSIAPLNDSVCFYGTSDGIYRNSIKQSSLFSSRINRVRIVKDKLIACTQEGVFAMLINRQGVIEHAEKILTANCYDLQSDSAFCYYRTDSGLIIANIKSGTVVNEIDSRAYAYTVNDFLVEDDTLMLATDNGIIKIPKAIITQRALHASPRTYITNSFSNYNPSVTSLTLPYAKKISVTLSVDVLDYCNETGNNYYQIKLDGNDISNWQIMNGTVVTLNDLKPGKYAITVLTENKYSRIANSTIHTIIIEPRWYQKGWPQIILIILLAGLVGYSLFRLYKWQWAKAQKKMNDALRINELESKNLFSQLKPHFIFNILTPLQSYFLKGDDIGGLEYIDNYAKLMRGFLQQSRDSYTTLTKEMEFLSHYLLVQQRRFNNSFAYSIELDSVLNGTSYYIPTLLLQPIVENAIEHGLNKDVKSSKSVLIKVERQKDILQVCISDNGIGLLQDEVFLKPNHALQIIKERLELLRTKYKIGSFSIGANGDSPGVTVIVHLPILTTKP